MTDKQDDSAEELARSYGEMLARPWADLPDAGPAAEEGDASAAPPPPLARIVEALLFVGGPQAFLLALF